MPRCRRLCKRFGKYIAAVAGNAGRAWHRRRPGAAPAAAGRCAAVLGPDAARHLRRPRSEEHTSELQSLMRISYAVFCLKKKTKQYQRLNTARTQLSNTKAKAYKTAQT